MAKGRTVKRKAAGKAGGGRCAKVTIGAAASASAHDAAAPVFALTASLDAQELQRLRVRL